MAIELAEKICRSSPHSVATTLQAQRDVLSAATAIGWTATDRARAAVLASEDMVEGRAAFFERRSIAGCARGS